MKVLLFSDLHDSNRGLWAIIDFLNKRADISGLVFAGDLTNMGEPISFAEKFIAEISCFKLPLLWVPGNNDFGASYKVLQNQTPSLEGRIVELGGSKFTGIGGSPASWSGQYQGENTLAKEKIAGTILVSHYPPANLVNLEKFDKVNPKSLPRRQADEILNSKQIQISNNKNSKHVSDFGFRASNLPRKIVDFPLAHICGHIHHTWGIGWIGQTKIIKLASLQLGYLAIMDLDNLAVEFMRMT